MNGFELKMIKFSEEPRNQINSVFWNIFFEQKFWGKNNFGVLRHHKNPEKFPLYIKLDYVVSQEDKSENKFHSVATEFWNFTKFEPKETRKLIEKIKII